MTDEEKKTKEFSRRDFLKAAGGTMALAAAIPTFLQVSAHAQASGQTQVTWEGSHAVSQYDPGKPIVYFTRDLSPEGVQKIYEKINKGITGKVGIKLHTGEPHGPNLLPIEYIKNLQSQIPRSSIVECNVLYKSPRRETATHRDTIKINGFDFCPVDILDEDGDVLLPIPGMKEFLDKQMDNRGKYSFEPGIHLQEIAVGKHVLNYDSLLVYTHFKGHTMGGFGGSLKNIGIGMASGKVGKRMIHGEGWPRGKGFLERMVESGKATTEHFKGHITYINVLKNISVDCDCAGASAAKATCDDIGIRLDRYSGGRPGLCRPDLSAACRPTPRYRRTHGIPFRPASAGIYGGAGHGQPGIQSNRSMRRKTMKRLTAIVLSLSLLVSVSAFTGKAMAAESQTITRAGSQPSYSGPAEYFTGIVRVDPLFPVNDSANFSGAYVTFEPGARSAWHIHPAGQRLIVTAGAGWTQQWDGPIVEIRAGDVIWCPPGVKHWHGASPTTPMTHLALTGVLDGKSVEWLEKVSDEQYAP